MSKIDLRTGRLLAATIAHLSILNVTVLAAEPDAVAPKLVEAAENTEMMFHFPRPDIQVSDDGRTLTLRGPIAQGTYFDFVARLRSEPRIRIVYLASDGGIIEEGFLIGNLMRKYKLDSYVGSYCASACTQIFIAGQKRAIGQNARLGFHQAYFVTPQGEIVADPDGLAFARESALAGKIELRPAADSILGLSGSEHLARSYRKAGVHEDFIARVLDTLPEDMWLPSHEEMQAAGIINAQLPMPQIPNGLLVERADTDAALLASPLWQAVAETRPDTFTSKAEEFWRHINAGVGEEELLSSETERLKEQLVAELGQAPDSLLDEFAVFFGKLASHFRDTDYAQCDANPLDGKQKDDAQLKALLNEENNLFARYLRLTEHGAGMSNKAAKKTLEKNYSRLLKAGLDPDDATLPDCISGHRMLEATAKLHPKYRATVIRAILSFREEDDADHTVQ